MSLTPISLPHSIDIGPGRLARKVLRRSARPQQEPWASATALGTETMRSARVADLKTSCLSVSTRGKKSRTGRTNPLLLRDPALLVVLRQCLRGQFANRRGKPLGEEAETTRGIQPQTQGQGSQVIA